MVLLLQRLTVFIVPCSMCFMCNHRPVYRNTRFVRSFFFGTFCPEESNHATFPLPADVQHIIKELHLRWDSLGGGKACPTLIYSANRSSQTGKQPLPCDAVKITRLSWRRIYGEFDVMTFFAAYFTCNPLLQTIKPVKCTFELVGCGWWILKKPIQSKSNQSEHGNNKPWPGYSREQWK